MQSNQLISNFQFGTLEKVKFYVAYLMYKVVCIPFETKKNVLSLYLYEFMFIWYRFVTGKVLPSPFNTAFIETRFGKFHFRPKTLDLLAASPAYERRDVNFLLRSICSAVAQNKKVAFLDVGADFGYYSVLVGNLCKNDDKFHLYAFEPFQDSYNLLLQNLRANNLEHKATCFMCALTNEDETSLSFSINAECPGSSTVLEKTMNKPVDHPAQVKGMKMDTLLERELAGYDIVFVKMDVEGHEKQVVEGAKNTLGNANSFLLVEDFVDESIVGVLEREGFRFLGKFTPYNSFWSLDKRP